MKKTLFNIFLILCFSRIVNAQNTFEKGYVITNNNEKIECLIKNEDWNNNPDFFYYKLNENEPVKKGDFTNTKEFEIYEKFKYVKAHLPIDESSNNLSELSNSFDPIFTKTVIFLKVLIEGDISIYEKENGINSKYFYKTLQNDTIYPLIYKKYSLDIYRVHENKTYIGEIHKITKGDKESIKNLKYKKEEIVNYIIKYHQDNNLEYHLYDKLERRGFIYNYFNVSMKMNHIFPIIGFENELNYNYRNKKWSFILNPSLSLFNPNNSSVNSFFNLQLTIRRYILNREKAKHFIDIGIGNFFVYRDKESLRPYFFIDSYLLSPIIGNGYSIGYGLKSKKLIYKITTSKYNYFLVPNFTNLTVGYKIGKN